MAEKFELTAGKLRIAGLTFGRAGDPAVMLMHGFPYDIHCYSEVAPALARQGCFVVVPYLRGYGPTRFIDSNTLRSGEQAVLGADLLHLMDAMAIPNAVLAGYDWGGRAACVVSALWPERVNSLVTCGGYNIQNIASANEPADPMSEYRYWYQYYFHSERGRAGLQHNRKDLCRLLWRLWSPKWKFSDETFDRSAEAFENPDFVDVVIHSYRHRYGLVDGDPDVADIEARLARQPTINVPSVALIGQDNGVMPPQPDRQLSRQFSGPFRIQHLDDIGHNVPQETPDAFVEAVLSVAKAAGH